MAVVALLAMLMSAVAPSVSRVLASSAHQAAPLLLEMCTAAGLATIEVPAPTGAGDDSGQPAPRHAMDEACGYCFLVTSQPVFLLLLCLLALRAPMATTLRPATALLRPRRNSRGLGSQAPPIAL